MHNPKYTTRVILALLSQANWGFFIQTDLNFKTFMISMEDGPEALNLQSPQPPKGPLPVAQPKHNIISVVHSSIS